MARLPLTVFAVLALAWLAAIALRTGGAGIIVHDAVKEIGSWIAARSQPGTETIGWVEGELRKASAQAPRDPAVHELLGMLRMQESGRPEEAVLNFGKALELRPTSPYTWANLAEAKYRSGDTGPMFERALARASQLGPAEPEVQRMVSDLGLAVWKEVAPETRVSIERMVADGMKRNPLETLRIAQRRGRLDVACRHLIASPLRADPKWSQSCQGTEATP